MSAVAPPDSRVANDCSQMHGLIGFSGFVGQHLAEQAEFHKIYRSSNIEEIQNAVFNVLVCAGVPAVKWQANRDPENDFFQLKRLRNLLKSVTAQQFILISTIDVYPDTCSLSDEDARLEGSRNHAYGTNRLWFETEMQQQFSECLIVRLPALFGRHMKKNCIYDLLHHRTEFIININLSSVFQWYNVDRLWDDICIALDNDLKLVNFFTEPITMRQIVEELFPKYLSTCQGDRNADSTTKYKLATKFGKIWGNERGFIISADQVMKDLRTFICGYVPPISLEKLCVSNIAWDACENKEILDFLRFKGVRKLEIAPSKILNSWRDIDTEPVVQALTTAYTGFKIESFQSILFNTVGLELFGSTTARNDLSKHCEAVIRLANSVGAKIIVWGSPKQRVTHGHSLEECFTIACAFFRHLGDYAHEKNVIIGFEANAREYGCDFCYDTSQAAQLVRAVNSPGFRLHLDSANIHLAGDDVTVAVQQNFDILTHVQASEPFLGTFQAPIVNHKEFANQLERVYYKGSISIEMRRADPPLQAVAQALAYVSRAYYNLLRD